jgi:50S ribosomal subunit-associated GTPase HflX
VSISGNTILAAQADQAVNQKRSEFERASAESNNPQLLETLVGQLQQAGQVPPDATPEQQKAQARRFIDGRLGQLKQQVQQAERARSLTLGQRRFSGTAVALVLALATAAVALAAVL